MLEALRGVRDPELPISIVDLGIVESWAVKEGGRSLEVVLRTTRTSCPARQQIAREVERTLGEAFPGITVTCRWAETTTWTPSLITREGKEALAEYGYGVEGGSHEATICPTCGSPSLEREARFASSPCLAFYFCHTCRRPYEFVRVQAIE